MVSGQIEPNGPVKVTPSAYQTIIRNELGTSKTSRRTATSTVQGRVKNFPNTSQTPAYTGRINDNDSFNTITAAGTSANQAMNLNLG